MRFRFWRRDPAPTPSPLPCRAPLNQGPSWATQPTHLFPTSGPGRAGNLTRAQQWRANGARW
ncbi:hypothetical protein C1I99_14270 [Micromonospora deserti]|uniref:Uncharacterized protein n=1 Tax=Micromonospora deserti TaxID=2070366 RepID=A0A2W2DB77_9ACTN|nr:hypothetical protein C1I99_14270 [Micromonospora deserti]